MTSISLFKTFFNDCIFNKHYKEPETSSYFVLYDRIKLVNISNNFFLHHTDASELVREDFVDAVSHVV